MLESRKSLKSYGVPCQTHEHDVNLKMSCKNPNNHKHLRNQCHNYKNKGNH